MPGDARSESLRNPRTTQIVNIEEGKAHRLFKDLAAFPFIAIVLNPDSGDVTAYCKGLDPDALRNISWLIDDDEESDGTPQDDQE